MKESIKNLWIEALRSGEYEQTVHALSGELGYCCLGVLCEVAIKNGLKIEVVDADNCGLRSYDGEEETLPQSVKEWAGMNNSMGDLPDRALYQSLIMMNDEEGKSFKQIARAIGHFWKEL